MLSEAQTCYYVFFGVGNIHNIVSTLLNNVKLDVENDGVISKSSKVAQDDIDIDDVVSTLFDIVNSNVDIHSVVSVLV